MLHARQSIGRFTPEFQMLQHPGHILQACGTVALAAAPISPTGLHLAEPHQRGDVTVQRAYRDGIVAFYTQHNPGQVCEVITLMPICQSAKVGRTSSQYNKSQAQGSTGARDHTKCSGGRIAHAKRLARGADIIRGRRALG